MSTRFADAAKAMAEDPALGARVMAAGTPAERAEVLKAAGLEVPTLADVSEHEASLADVVGAGDTASQVASAAGPATAAAIAAS